ncbi:MAG: hypothetical protein QW530_00405 [Candidatus Micrarchaeaceae archaeon]
MLFGKRRAEEIPAGALGGYAIALFDGKLSKVNSRCAKSMAKLDGSLKRFEEACAELGKLDAMPDLESIASGSSKAIAEQKPRYVKELVSIIDSLRHSISAAKAPTKYEELLAKKALFEGAMEDMLKLNAVFRGVLVGYGGYFGNIKKAFKALENDMAALRLEIDKGSVDFLNHKNLIASIAKLSALIDEFSALNSESVAIQQERARAEQRSVDEAEIARLSVKISDLSKEIESIEQKKKSIAAEINAMLAPLERVARKYDHSVASKFKLMEAIKNPFEAMRSSESYSKFIDAVRDMRSKIALIEPNQRELDSIKQRLDIVLSSNMLDAIYEVSELSDKEKPLLSELNDVRALLAEIEDLKKGKENIENAIKANEEKQATILAKISSTKENIEKLFNLYYKKKVSIRIG